GPQWAMGSRRLQRSQGRRSRHRDRAGAGIRYRRNHRQCRGTVHRQHAAGTTRRFPSAAIDPQIHRRGADATPWGNGRDRLHGLLSGFEGSIVCHRSGDQRERRKHDAMNTTMTNVLIGRLEEFPEGEIRKATLPDGTDIAVYNVGGTIYATADL